MMLHKHTHTHTEPLLVRELEATFAPLAAGSNSSQTFANVFAANLVHISIAEQF